jgi:hypothetical protein
MMLKALLLLSAALACIVLATQARADVTIRNYDGGGANQANEVNLFDTQRNHISATNGALIQLQPGTYNSLTECTGSPVCFGWYGDPWGCGFREGQTSDGANPHGPPWCGVAVYISPDLVHWTNHGSLIDPNATNVDAPGGTISQGCAGLGAAGGGGGGSRFCGIAKVRWNPNTSLYNLWISLPTNSSVTTTNYVNVFTCTSPVGGCTQHPQISFTPYANGINDLEPLVDGTNIYMFHTDQQAQGSFNVPTVWVEQLASDGLSSTGQIAHFSSIGEGISAFKAGSNFFYLSGGGCNYCNFAVTQVYETTTNMASWPNVGPSGATTISNSTCEAQNFNVSTIVAGGKTTYLMKATRFVGTQPPNYAGFWGHGMSNEFWYPLSVSGATISPMIGCPNDTGYPGSMPNVITVPGITAAAPPAFTADQTSEGGAFGSHCDIVAAGTAGPQNSRMQVFTPSQNFTATIEFMAAACIQPPTKNTSGNGAVYCASGGAPPGCPGPDSTLLVQLFRTTGSGTAAVPTGSPLATYTGNPQSNVTWAQGSPNPVPFSPTATQMTGVTLQGGVTYALVQSMASPATVGGYASTYDQTGTNPYPAGFEAHSANWPTGNTWVVDANVALKFSVINTGPPGMPPTGGFRRFGHH